MKITKSYLKQLIKEELEEVSGQGGQQTAAKALSPVKKELLAILSQRVGNGMDAELMVHVLTDQEAEVLLRQQKASHTK